MSCCLSVLRRCDPATGEPVAVVTNFPDGSRLMYVESSLELWEGDFGSLVPCPDSGGPNVDRFDQDFLMFDTNEQIPPRVAYCDGDLSVFVAVTSAPVGGDETFNLIIGGALVDTFTLTAGQTTTSAGVWAVAAGDVIQIVAASSTATTPSSGGSVRFVVECGGTSGGSGGVTYTVTTQPTSASGAVGDTISLGGAVNTGGMNWETSTSASGPWTATTEPVTIGSEGTVYYRFCADDGITCSDVVTVTGTAASTIFDPTTPTGSIETQGNNIVDAAGNRIFGGGANVSLNTRVEAD